MARYHLPLFWLALFTAEQLVPRRYQVIRDGKAVWSKDEWPYLIAEKDGALRLLESRSAYLVRAFSSDIGEGLRQFIDFLGADKQPFIHVCTMEIGGMVGTAAEWWPEMKVMLSLFSEEPPRFDGDPQGAPQLEQLPPGWRKYIERMTANFRIGSKIDMHYFAGESEAVHTKTPWQPNVDDEYDRAIADYNEAIRLDAKDVTAYNARGTAWRAKGDLDRAIADYNEAIKLDPKYAHAYVNRGRAWESKGECDRAIGDYDQAIRLHPDYTDAYIDRGRAWESEGDYDRAIVDYSEAIRLDPGYAPAYVNRGRTWQSKGDYDRAIVDYSEAIRLDPGYAPAYVNRGHAWESNGECDRAVSDYNEAIRLDPNDAWACAARSRACKD
jgi:tetratricopeptide (TPR) repeat protein